MTIGRLLLSAAATAMALSLSSHPATAGMVNTGACSIDTSHGCASTDLAPVPVPPVGLNTVEAFTPPAPDLFATDPASIARGSGVCTAPTDEDCYVSLTTDQTGATVVQDSTDRVGTSHTLIFTCGPALADLAGSGASDPGPLGDPPGCYDVQAVARNPAAGRSTNITAASCGYNLATVSGSSSNCDSTQSPLCPAVPSDASRAADQGQVTGATDVSECASTDAASPLGQRVDLVFNPPDPATYLITVTGYTLPCGGATAAGADADDTPCTSTQGATSSPDVRCPTGMTYLPPGGAGFALIESIGFDPFEAQIPILEGVCQFALQVEPTYVVTAESIQHELAALVTSGDVSLRIGRILVSLFETAATLRAHGNCRGAASVYTAALRLVHIFTGRGVSAAAAAALNRDLQYLITHCP
jgi:hypothetical protein